MQLQLDKIELPTKDIKKLHLFLSEALDFEFIADGEKQIYSGAGVHWQLGKAKAKQNQVFHLNWSNCPDLEELAQRFDFFQFRHQGILVDVHLKESEILLKDFDDRLWCLHLQ